jgi:hypothetical protein
MTDHNSSEHDNSSTTIQDGDHLVTESLLSWAKDVRYVREIQSMLAEAAEPLFSGASIAPSVVSKGTWYASYLLYILISVGRQGRTLGMGATGLQLTISSGHNSLSKRRIVGSLMALGMSTWALDWWATKSDRESESSHSEGLRGIERQRRHELLRQQMLQRATSSSQSTVVVHSNQSQSRESNNSSEELSFQGKLVNNLQTLIKVRQRYAVHCNFLHLQPTKYWCPLTIFCSPTSLFFTPSASRPAMVLIIYLSTMTVHLDPFP